MKINFLKKAVIGGMLGAMCLGFSMVSAEEVQRGPLNDGELFQSMLVCEHSKVLYSTASAKDWVWHGQYGYPEGMKFFALANGKNLPAEPAEIGAEVPSGEDKMLAAAKAKYQTDKYENKIVLYGTTGPAAAQTEMAITKVELFGRVLNVTVSLKDAEPNTPLTMNLIYPEVEKTIGYGAFPKAGGALKVRFVDVQGHALYVEDIQLPSRI